MKSISIIINKSVKQLVKMIGQTVGQMVGQTVSQTVKPNGRSKRSVGQRFLTGYDRPMTDRDRPLPSLIRITYPILTG